MWMALLCSKRRMPGIANWTIVIGTSASSPASDATRPFGTEKLGTRIANKANIVTKGTKHKRIGANVFIF